MGEIRVASWSNYFGTSWYSYNEHVLRLHKNTSADLQSKKIHFISYKTIFRVKHIWKLHII